MLPPNVLEHQDRICAYMQNVGIDPAAITNPTLLLQACIHKSYAADFKESYDDNERLEFLGDGILWAIINSLLYRRNPDMSEADLTLYKIALVRQELLAEVARDIGLDTIIFLWNGEEKMQGRSKDVILSDTLEALIGYIHLDLWRAEAKKFVDTYIYSKIAFISTQSVKSYKTLLQERAQKNHKKLPVYVDTPSKVDTKKNVLEYISEVFLLDEKRGEGRGANKKKAQEEAAKMFYESL